MIKLIASVSFSGVLRWSTNCNYVILTFIGSILVSHCITLKHLHVHMLYINIIITCITWHATHVISFTYMYAHAIRVHVVYQQKHIIKYINVHEHTLDDEILMHTLSVVACLYQSYHFTAIVNLIVKQLMHMHNTQYSVHNWNDTHMIYMYNVYELTFSIISNKRVTNSIRNDCTLSWKKKKVCNVKSYVHMQSC